jgi:hypothetical protein
MECALYRGRHHYLCFPAHSHMKSQKHAGNSLEQKTDDYKHRTEGRLFPHAYIMSNIEDAAAKEELGN